MSHAFLYFLSLLAARTLIVFLALVAGLRLLGKRQIGQMNIYDLALIMALANAVQNAMTSGKGDLAVGIVCAGTLLLLGRSLTALFLHLPRLEKHLVGTPTLLISNGRIIREHLEREQITEEQLRTALRQHSLTKPEQAKLVVLEVDGSLSVVPQEKMPPKTDKGKITL